MGLLAIFRVLGMLTHRISTAAPIQLKITGTQYYYTVKPITFSYSWGYHTLHSHVQPRRTIRITLGGSLAERLLNSFECS